VLREGSQLAPIFDLQAHEQRKNQGVRLSAISRTFEKIKKNDKKK